MKIPPKRIANTETIIEAKRYRIDREGCNFLIELKRNNRSGQSPLEIIDSRRFDSTFDSKRSVKVHLPSQEIEHIKQNHFDPSSLYPSNKSKITPALLTQDNESASCCIERKGEIVNLLPTFSIRLVRFLASTLLSNNKYEIKSERDNSFKILIELGFCCITNSGRCDSSINLTFVKKSDRFVLTNMF